MQGLSSLPDHAPIKHRLKISEIKASYSHHLTLKVAMQSVKIKIMATGAGIPR